MSENIDEVIAQGLAIVAESIPEFVAFEAVEDILGPEQAWRVKAEYERRQRDERKKR